MALVPRAAGTQGQAVFASASAAATGATYPEAPALYPLVPRDQKAKCNARVRVLEQQKPKQQKSKQQKPEQQAPEGDASSKKRKRG